MKAQRATVELGMMGSWYVVAGLVALAQAIGHRKPELGLPAVVLGALVVAASIALIGMAVYRLRGIEGLPATARRASWLAVAARASLASALPAATAVFLSVTSTDAGWILGLTFLVLGAALCTVAALATHVEHLCGARVWRADRRFYFAR